MQLLQLPWEGYITICGKGCDPHRKQNLFSDFLYIVYAIAYYNILCLWHYIYFYLHLYVHLIYNYTHICYIWWCVFMCVFVHVFPREAIRQTKNTHTKGPLPAGPCCLRFKSWHKVVQYQHFMNQTCIFIFVEDTPGLQYCPPQCIHPTQAWRQLMLLSTAGSMPQVWVTEAAELQWHWLWPVLTGEVLLSLLCV